MKEIIVSLVTAMFNIAAIVLRAAGFTTIADVLYQIMPEVNIIAVGVLYFFGYKWQKLARGNVV